MKAKFKTINSLEIAYINLSEQLREELELKIESLYNETRFAKYGTMHIVNYQNAAAADFLCAHLIGKAPRNYVLSGKLLQGIKIWFNMYYDDRLSVIDKFRICYRKVKPQRAPNDMKYTSIVFCKFLINELLSTLADRRWQLLVDMPDQQLAFNRHQSKSALKIRL